MIYNNKQNNLVLKIFTVIFMCSFLLGLTKSYANSPVRHLKYILMGIFIIFYLAKNVRIKINTVVSRVFILMIITNTIIPIFELLFRDSNNEQVILYSILCLVFISFSIVIATILQNEEVGKIIIKYFLLTIGIFTLVMFFTNNTSYSLSDLFKVLDNYDRVRSSFGFSHTNTLGNITIAYLLLDFYNLRILKNNNNLFNVLRIFIFYVLLRAASRTSLIGFTIFISIYLAVLVVEKVKINKKIKIGFIMIGVTIVGIIVSRIVVNPDFLKETNRYGHLLYNYELIVNSNNWLIGLGNVNPLDIYNFSIELSVNDNWFLYLFIVQGLVGIILFLFIIIYKFKYVVCNIFDYNQKAFYIALLVVNIILSMFEMYYFVPGVLSSLVYWMFIMDMLLKVKKAPKLRRGKCYV